MRTISVTVKVRIPEESDILRAQPMWGNKIVTEYQAIVKIINQPEVMLSAREWIRVGKPPITAVADTLHKWAVAQGRELTQEEKQVAGRVMSVLVEANGHSRVQDEERGIPHPAWVKGAVFAP